MKTKIILDKISFEYGEKSKVFDEHSMQVEAKSGLYGVIGPSGTGKTTLISILGGQLKPQSGKVIINDIDIYSVGDKKRRDLIAMQLQTSTAMRGKLRYNLLFGIIPKEDGEEQYTDQELEDVLHKVGLWEIFFSKDGLETLIGEGGLNLSGGQRQRLNFASLYLRAMYYKPKMVLIDEPTSSLDEISEQSITKMIDDLSSNSITFVVAHRLKTLEKAVSLIDSSLFSQSKMIRTFTDSELRESSEYYKDILQGTVILDS